VKEGVGSARIRERIGKTDKSPAVRASASYTAPEMLNSSDWLQQ